MIFVCLGNPGKKYAKTRHNFGRLFGRFIINELMSLRVKKNKFGEIWQLPNNWRVVFLNCFMNESGACFLKLLSKSRLFLSETRNQKPETKLFVVHDDLDLPFGEFKIQFGRGAAGHHGVESIIKTLETKDFWRIRLGIDEPPANIDPEKYVLMPFNRKEKKELPSVFEEVLAKIQSSKFSDS